MTLEIRMYLVDTISDGYYVVDVEDTKRITEALDKGLDVIPLYQIVNNVEPMWIN